MMIHCSKRKLDAFQTMPNHYLITMVVVGAGLPCPELGHEDRAPT
jgi:hypothetical protein